MYFKQIFWKKLGIECFSDISAENIVKIVTNIWRKSEIKLFSMICIAKKLL